jgi:hypothetical protein
VDHQPAAADVGRMVIRDIVTWYEYRWWTTVTLSFFGEIVLPQKKLFKLILMMMEMRPLMMMM